MGVNRPPLDVAELLDWSDPETGLKVLDSANSSFQATSLLAQTLEVRGMLCADDGRDEEVIAILTRLQSMATKADLAAQTAAHFVQAYFLTAHDRFDEAKAELNFINLKTVPSTSERYRLLTLEGTVARRLGEHERAARFYEQALDAANALRDDSRALQAMLYLIRVFMNVGNIERAVAQLTLARTMANQLGDEVALVDIERKESELAVWRGDNDAAMHASLAALAHAEHTGSSKWLAAALVNLASSYMSTGEFALALSYSKKALPLARKVHSTILEQTTLSNEGIANIRLGNLSRGKELAENAIAVEMAHQDLFNAADLLQDYASALEYGHDWRSAIAAYHRYDDVRDRLMTAARQRALLELTNKFDDERKARELELLRRDKALKIAETHAQRLREQRILIGAAFIACICAVLIWSSTRVRQANKRLRWSAEHDALTGLPNRRYFNERVLTAESNRVAKGCIILADLDHFKRINDAYGHPAGDAVLSAISQRLSAVLRTDDTLVRWGGEEFLAILGPMDEPQADAMARRIVQVVRSEPIQWRKQFIPCTISVGYAIFPVDAVVMEVSLDNAISLADKALYAAKRRGRDRACRIKMSGPVTAQTAGETSGELEANTSGVKLHIVETLDEAA